MRLLMAVALNVAWILTLAMAVVLALSLLRIV